MGYSQPLLRYLSVSWAVQQRAVEQPVWLQLPLVLCLEYTYKLGSGGHYSYHRTCNRISRNLEENCHKVRVMIPVVVFYALVAAVAGMIFILKTLS